MTTPAPNWGRIPVELRQRNYWCIAGPDKAPYYLPNPGQPLRHASVTDARTWMSFADAANIAFACGQGIGYVCQADDPFTCIDIDYKDYKSDPDKPEIWTTPEQVERGWAIVREFETYTEYSRRGDTNNPRVHLWVGGKIGQGARRENIEIYSQQRFIICTGNVLYDSPITPSQPLLDKLLDQIRTSQGSTRTALYEQEQHQEDKELIERAVYAANGPKFNELCSGGWESMGFPSQSEADLALMSIFTFYTESNEQCRRLFRMSKLGKRDKAQKDNRYLDLTLSLIRGRQKREAKVSEATRASSSALVERMMAAVQPLQAIAALSAPQAPNIPPQPPQPPPSAPQVHETNGSLNGNGYHSNGILYDEPGLAWPPGFAGEIARFIYHSSPRPVREVAIVATLGILAGICGRAYTVPQSGLNMYVILVARSAIGKEAMHSGISLLLKEAMSGIPESIHFVDFNDYASGQALIKRCAEVQSFVNVAGEWGRKLKRISQDDGRDAAMASLKTAMLNLYQKSGPQSIVGGLSYSNKDNNVSSVSGVAFSMVGETTPDTFYESLTTEMMADGFLSRFTIIEYAGDRPPTNHKQVMEMSEAAKQHFRDMIMQVITLNKTGRNHMVGRTDEAGNILVEFDKECDRQIKSTKDESWRQMWNRAHLKVVRISALLACATDNINPVAGVAEVNWALEVVRADIAMMTKRIQSGDVGQDDTSRERKMLDITKEYLSKPIKDSYGIPASMHREGIIPRKYLQLRTQQLNSFKSFRNGAIAALDSSLKSLCDSGYFIEMPKDKVAEAYSFHGRCYRVMDVGTKEQLH